MRFQMKRTNQTTQFIITDCVCFQSHYHPFVVLQSSVFILLQEMSPEIEKTKVKHNDSSISHLVKELSRVQREYQDIIDSLPRGELISLVIRAHCRQNIFSRPSQRKIFTIWFINCHHNLEFYL